MLAVLFHFSALAVLPFWLAMIAFPRASLTQRLVASPWIAVPPALCYLAFGAPHVGELLGVFAGPSPDGLARMMGEPWAAGMFWAYAGAFDLLIGRWIFLDSRERGIAHGWIAPILVVGILFGPIAYLAYAALCFVRTRRR